MTYVNPIWLEGQRQRWQRHDWQRWVRHDAHRFLTPAGIAEQKQGEETARRDDVAEQEQFERELLQVRRDLAALKLELALRRLGYKYSPDQPRSPKGNPDGGQWVTDSGRDGGLVSSPAAMRRGPSSRLPTLPLHVPLGKPSGQEAPRQRITIVNNAQTGLSTVDDTTEKLRATLENVVNKLPDGSGSGYGTKVHTDFANAVRNQDLPGIGRAGVEQTFPKDQPYGSADSIRTDVTLRDASGEPIAIYDVKTGGATLGPNRVRELLDNVSPSSRIPVVEMHVLRGISLKARVLQRTGMWIIVIRIWQEGLPNIADLMEGEGRS